MVRHRSALVLAVPLLVAMTAVAGCGDVDDATGTGRSGEKTVVVFAAASLTEAFTALGEKFEAAHPGTSVKFSFAGSDRLARQIVQGAPADVYASADVAMMKRVTDAGDAAHPRTFARNRLEIAVPPGNPGKVAELSDLTDPDLTVVLCAPEVPCGDAARRALAVDGLTVHPASLAQNVKAALTKVELGEADAALVYRTDVKAAGSKVEGIPFPEAAKAVNDYPIVTLKRAPHPTAAKRFVRLVLSDAGAATLTRFGFDRP